MVDIGRSKTGGIIYHNARDSDPDLLLRSFLVDLTNPWATLLERNSTTLCPVSASRRCRPCPAPSVSTSPISSAGCPSTTAGSGGTSLATWPCPLPVLLAVGYPFIYLGAVLIEVVAFSWLALAGGWLVFVGLAMVARARYKSPTGEPSWTSVIELLGTSTPRRSGARPRESTAN